MRTVEQVFALLAQANPVFDPAELPAALDVPGLLLPNQRNADMQTQDTPMRDVPAPAPRRKLSFVVAASVAVLAIGGLVGGWWLISTIGTPVAASDATPTITCDGVECSYDGPSRIEPGNVEFTLVNESDAIPLYLSGWLFDTEAALDADLARDEAGSDRAIAPDEPQPEAPQLIYFMAAAGRTETISYPLHEGQFYALDVVSFAADGSPNHLWRTATIEIVAP